MFRRQLFVAILFAGVLIMSLRPVADPDFWWHLRAGQWMVENRLILHQDIFSFTKAGQAWIAHEWLSEWLMYGLYRLGGLPLLILFFASLITVTFALLYLRSEGKPYLAGFALVLGFLATAPVLGARPQMFTFFLSSLYWYLLEGYRREGRLRWLIPIPFLMLLWVNLHGGYAMGVLLTGAFGLEAALERWNKRENNLLDTHHQAIHLGIALLLATAAVAANPNGLRMYRYPFETLGSPTMQAYIQEWFSPDFHLAHWQPLAVLLIVLLFAALLAHPRVSLANAALLAFFCYATLRSGRHVQFFVLAAVPVLSAAGENVLGKYLPAPPTETSPRLRWKARRLALTGLLLLAVLGRSLSVFHQQSESEAEKFPAHALAWIKANHPPQNLYNTYDWGGYLLWNLYPEYRVFIDGRADLYGDAFIEEFLSVYRGEEGWQARLQHYGVNTVLIQPAASLAKALQQSTEWVKVYEDELAVIFVRR